MNNATNFLAIGLGGQELMWIFVIILVLFGGAKIPQLMRSVGQGVGELQKGLDEGKRTLQKSVNEAANETVKTDSTTNTNPPA